MLGCKKRKTLKMKRRKKTGDYLDARKVICDMLSISESQMVVFFYISVKYSEIYKRKVMREN